MDITIHRKKGFLNNAFGRSAPLAVFFESACIGQLATGETLSLSLPDVNGTLQVGLLDTRNSPYIGSAHQSLVSISNPLAISPSPAVQAFSVRTRVWVTFDVIELAYWGPLRRWIFALERRAEG